MIAIKDDFYNDDRLIHQIYQTMRVFTKTLNTEINPLGIYSSEWTILNLIHKHGTLSQSAIVADLHVEPAAISKTLGKLEKKGFITRTTRTDRREKYISMTDHAMGLFPELERTVAFHRDRSLYDLSEEDRKVLLRLMMKIFDNVQE